VDGSSKSSAVVVIRLGLSAVVVAGLGWARRGGTVDGSLELYDGWVFGAWWWMEAGDGRTGVRWRW
jgi:hypothetical protein